MAIETPNMLSPLPKLPSPTTGNRSDAVMCRLLQQNYEKWSVFINDVRFHNHIPYHLLALWALGADGELLHAAYERGLKVVKPLKASPSPITFDNFGAHLGDPSYYDGYLQYYTRLDAGKNLEHYLFSADNNFVEGLLDNRQPRMLSRLMDGLLHPLIHLGLGIQSGIIGLTVQGLALIAVSLPSSTKYVGQDLANKLHLNRTADIHALSIMSRIAKDKRLVIRKALGELSMYEDCLDVNGDIVVEYVDDWIRAINFEDLELCQRKADELVWFNTVAYGGGYNRSSKSFVPDFFLMHLVTSASYFQSIHASLTCAASRLALLKAYFCASLTWWIAVGKPQLDIEEFYYCAKYPYPSQNWDPIRQTAINHKDEHFPKVIQILKRFEDTMHHHQCQDVDMKGARLLDHSFFWRLAAKTTEVVLLQQRLWTRAQFLNDEISSLPLHVTAT